MTEKAIVPEVLLPPEANSAAFEDWQATQKEAELDYAIFKASMEAKILSAAGRESMEKLIRVLHLRQVKEKLTPLGQWARWCQEAGIDARNADYEISKLGDWKDDLLTKFVSYAGIPLNKIRQLTNGDLQNLQVTTGNNQIMVNGEPVPLDQEEIQFVVDRLQEDVKRAERKAEEDKKAREEDAAETKKALKKAERELAKIKGDAEKKGLTPEENAFLKEMEQIRASFDSLMLQIDPERVAFLVGDNEKTPRQTAAYTTTLEYMRAQIAAACETAEKRQTPPGGGV